MYKNCKRSLNLDKHIHTNERIDTLIVQNVSYNNKNVLFSIIIETTFIQITPSLLASACICAATRGINSPSAPFALGDVCRLVQIDPFEVEFTVRHIEQVVAKETAALQRQIYKGQAFTSSNINKMPSSCAADVGQPETPTDIQDVYF